MSIVSELRAEITDLKEQLRIIKIKPLTKKELHANRAYAIENNEMFYMGRPCKHGHVGLRYRTKACVECQRIKGAREKRKAQPITSKNAHTAAW